MEENIEDIKRQIKLARTELKNVMAQRSRLAAFLSGSGMIMESIIEFPEPDIAHVYVMAKVGDPIVYRLSFGNPLRWVGVSHPWGVKPADIVVEE